MLSKLKLALTKSFRRDSQPAVEPWAQQIFDEFVNPQDPRKLQPSALEDNQKSPNGLASTLSGTVVSTGGKASPQAIGELRSGTDADKPVSRRTDGLPSTPIGPTNHSTGRQYLWKVMIVFGAALIAIGLMSFDPSGSGPSPDVYGTVSTGLSYGWFAKVEVAFGIMLIFVGVLSQKAKA